MEQYNILPTLHTKHILPRKKKNTPQFKLDLVSVSKDMFYQYKHFIVIVNLQKNHIIMQEDNPITMSAAGPVTSVVKQENCDESTVNHNASRATLFPIMHEDVSVYQMKAYDSNHRSYRYGKCTRTLKRPSGSRKKSTFVKTRPTGRRPSTPKNEIS